MMASPGWWIRLEGHRGPRMRRKEAAALVKTLEAMLREWEDTTRYK